jgi:Arc/MetJ-type ribon-helix-helix transcriptional regulator
VIGRRSGDITTMTKALFTFARLDRCDKLKDGRFGIMTIHLSKDLERFVRESVETGRYASEDDVVNDALARLRQTMPESNVAPDGRTKRAKPAKQKKPLTEAEFDRYLLRIGLMSQLPDTDADFDDPNDQLIEIRGEPLSETIIRERR